MSYMTHLLERITTYLLIYSQNNSSVCTIHIVQLYFIFHFSLLLHVISFLIRDNVHRNLSGEYYACTLHTYSNYGRKARGLSLYYLGANDGRVWRQTAERATLIRR